MCFNYKISFITFLLGTIFSILLLNTHNKYYFENKITGIFFIFISLIQLMEFFFWIDIKNKYNINKIATIIGPLLNAGQPTILYIIKYLYSKPNVFTINNFPVALLNFFYLIYLIVKYIKFIKNGLLVTSSISIHKHLIWPWLKYYNPYFYSILFAINIFYLFDVNYAIILFLLTFGLLYISNKFFKYNVGEMWCFFGSLMPLAMLGFSHYL